MKALIDGDILVYSCGFACQKNLHKVTILGEEEYGWQAAFPYKKQLKEWLAYKGLKEEDILIETEVVAEPLENALHNVKLTINSILKDVGADSHQIYITGIDNFRDKIATIKPYKGNRDKLHKPIYYQEIRDYLINRWDCIVVDGQEADDAIGIAQCRDNDDNSTIICSIDKDLDMIPGWHYNFKEGRKYFIDWESASRNFYKQLLMGDPTDNIQGVKGIGKAYASLLLDDVENEEDMFYTCLEQYTNVYGNDDSIDMDKTVMDILMENANLLWIRREPNQQWEPPI